LKQGKVAEGESVFIEYKTNKLVTVNLDAYPALECLNVSDWRSEIPILGQVLLEGIGAIEEGSFISSLIQESYLYPQYYGMLWVIL